MKTRIGKFASLLAVMLSLTLLIGGCGSGGSAGTTPTGTVSVNVTDAPGLEYQNVWITIKGVWLHTSADAGDVTNDPGWVKADLASPVTIDLATLATGNLQSLFSKPLPTGTYRQIRVFLVPTEAQPTASAQAAGLLFNNEIRLANDPTQYPLRVPYAEGGIKLIPETPVIVTAGGSANIAIDFNACEDIVETERQGTGGAANDVEFVLKPRLGYFDINNAAAITGSIVPPTPFTFANYTGKNFVIKAEQPNQVDGSYRVALRATTIKSDGSFVLYPLPVFGNATTATYDVMLRGRNVQTQIVTGVKVHKGTTAANGTSVGPAIVMTPDTNPEYTVQVNVNPTGSWVNFYQTLPGDPAPYEIRYRHVDPYSANGTFFQPIELSSDPLQVAPWNSGGVLSFNSTTPVEGAGNFSAVAVAILYDRSTALAVTPLTNTLLFGSLSVSAPAVARQVTGTIQVPLTMTTLNSGAIFAVQGGMIVNRLDVNTLMQPGNNSYIFGSLPGGTPATPLPGAFYGLYAVGWDSTSPKASRVYGGPDFVDLRTINGIANFLMWSFY
jgi:hypothetical protein